MNNKLKSTLGIILAAFPADPVADVLATQAKESARFLLAQGWDLAGGEYAIAVMHGDAEAAGDLLGRKLTNAEATALEACIRACLADAAD